MGDREQQQLRRQLRSLLLRMENRYCVDCRAEGPTWASINLGIFLCLDCAGIHRSLGTHISKVRSVTMDKWCPDWVQFMTAVGNYRANLYWECNNKFGDKISHRASGRERLNFIRTKYEEKKWYGIPVAPGQKQTANNSTTNTNSTNASATKITPLPPPTSSVSPSSVSNHAHQPNQHHHHHAVGANGNGANQNIGGGLFAGMGGASSSINNQNHPAPDASNGRMRNHQSNVLAANDGKSSTMASTATNGSLSSASSSAKQPPRSRRLAAGSPWVKRKPVGSNNSSNGCNSTSNGYNQQQQQQQQPTKQILDVMGMMGAGDGGGGIVEGNGEKNDDIFDGLNVQEAATTAQHDSKKAPPSSTIDFASLMDDGGTQPPPSMQRAQTVPIAQDTTRTTSSTNTTNAVALGSLDDLFGAQLSLSNDTASATTAKGAGVNDDLLYGNPFGSGSNTAHPHSNPNNAGSSSNNNNNIINTEKQHNGGDNDGPEASSFGFLGGGDEDSGDGGAANQQLDQSTSPTTQQKATTTGFSGFDNDDDDEKEANGFDFLGGEGADGEKAGNDNGIADSSSGGGDGFDFLNNSSDRNDDRESGDVEGEAFGFLGGGGNDDKNNKESNAAEAKPVHTSNGNFQGFDFLGNNGNSGANPATTKKHIATGSATNAAGDPFAGLF